MSDQYQYRGVLSARELRLYAKNSEDKWATMHFEPHTSGRKNNDNVLEIVVWTNVQSDADKSIKASLDVVTAGIFMNNLKDCIEARVEPGQEFVAPIIDFMATRWRKENGRHVPDGEFVQAKLHMGKDVEGRVWLGLVSTKQGRPNLKFIFHSNKQRHLVMRDGSRVPESVSSVLAAKSFLDVLKNVFYTHMFHNYVPPQPKNQGNNQNRGYQNNQGGNNGGNYNQGNHQSNNSNSYDDDLPF